MQENRGVRFNVPPKDNLYFQAIDFLFGEIYMTVTFYERSCRLISFCESVKINLHENIL